MASKRSFAANPLAGDAGNPMMAAKAAHGAHGATHTMHVESLSGAHKLKDVGPLVAKLKAADGNDARIALLADEKEGWLFSCEQVKAVCEVTPSVKTRIAFVEALGPRTWDPKHRSLLVELFRYADEKTMGEATSHRPQARRREQAPVPRGLGVPGPG